MTLRLLRRAFLVFAISAAFIATLTPAIASADQSCGNGYMVGGRIEQEWIVQGKAAVLGNCSTPEKAAARNGRFQGFGPNTFIYWNANVANGYAKLVRGDIYKKWQEFDWEQGPFGFPTISEATLGKNGGKYSTFEGGSIYWSPNTGAHQVWGALRDLWGQAGYENGRYGYPVTDEYPLNGGYQQLFEGGYLNYNVGPDPDDDPNRTDPVIGVDDPYKKFSPRYAGDVGVTGDTCSAPNSEGIRGCLLLGDESAPVDNTAQARRATPPSSSSETSTAPRSSQSPSSSSQAPSTTTPPSSTQAPDPAPSTTSSSPSGSAGSESSQPPTSSGAPSTAPCPSTTSTTPTEPAQSVQPCASTTTGVAPAVSDRGPQDHGSATGNRGTSSGAFRVEPVSNNDPELGGVKEPDDPARSTANERQYFGQGECVGHQLKTFYGQRFYSCGTVPYKYVLTKDQTTALYWSKGYIYFLENSSATSTESQVLATVDELVTAGAAATPPVVTMYGTNSASGGVSTSPSAGTPKPLSSKPQQLFKVRENTVASGPGNIRHSSPMVTIQIQAPATGGGATAPSARTYTLPEIRCDSLTYIPSAGCVMRPDPRFHNVPVLDLTTKSNIQLFDHILHAQNSLLPGSPLGLSLLNGVIPKLTRISKDDPQRGKNRSLACPGRIKFYRPKSGSYDCDEYPFAITREGAGSSIGVPAAQGRTFNFCSMTNRTDGKSGPPLFPDGDQIKNSLGWSSCFVPADQNRSAGGMLPSFFDKNRILANEEDPDGFVVNAYHL